MSIRAVTVYTIKCDFCFEVLANGSDPDTVFTDASKRSIYRFDYGRLCYAHECNNCQAKRQIKQELIHGKT